jgi:hypothetical protein
MVRRQPLAARVWGRNYRTWWPAEPGPRHRKKAKRRSAKRERQLARRIIRGYLEFSGM